jgi:hypothetical protein
MTPRLLVTAGTGIAVVVAAAVAVPSALLPVVGVTGLVLAAPLLRSLARGAAWMLPLLAGLAVLLTDTAGRSIAPGAARYLATAAVVVTVVLVGVGPDTRSRALRTAALVLFGYGLLGTLYGRFALGTVNGTLPLIGPMVIACLPPVRNRGPADWRLGLRTLAAAGTVFALGSGLSRLGVLPATQIDVLNHEKAFVVVLGIAAALAARDRWLVLASLAAAAFAFSTYPAATYLVAAVTALGTLLLARWSPRTGTRIALAVVVMAGTVVAVLNVDRLIALTQSYFRLVGKIDNGDTREALYRTALSRLTSPVFSHFFTGDITVVGNLSGTDRVVPVHNDYLSITLGGGFVAAALLLGLFLFANGLALRTLRQVDDAGQRRTVVVLLAAVNAAAVSAFANPIFMNPGASAVTFAVLAALVAVCRVPGYDSGTERATTQPASEGVSSSTDAARPWRGSRASTRSARPAGSAPSASVRWGTTSANRPS